MYRDEMPVNEYLTMQIANKVYGIDTAPCPIIRLKDNKPALLVKRFDVEICRQLAPFSDGLSGPLSFSAVPVLPVLSRFGWMRLSPA